MGGLPFRMFLLMAGISMAIKFEGQIARGIERSAMVRGGVWRGFEILVLAYLFRLQEYALSFFWDWHDLLRVDILNCIGASMMLAAPLAAPRRGRPQIVVCLVVAAAFVALGPLIGPTRAFTSLPLAFATSPRTSAARSRWPGSRCSRAFAWLLVGIAIGHWWARASRDGRLTRAFVIGAVGGAAMAGTVMLIRRMNPYIIHYPSEYAQQMGPGTFFYRLGTIGPLALLAYVMTTGPVSGAVLGDADLRADVAAGLLGARRAGLRPAVQALRQPAEHGTGHGRLRADDGGDARACDAAPQVLAGLAARIREAERRRRMA